MNSVHFDGVPQAGWMVYLMEDPIEIDDLGLPPFMETPISMKVAGFNEVGKQFVSFDLVEMIHHFRRNGIRLILKNYSMGLAFR